MSLTAGERHMSMPINRNASMEKSKAEPAKGNDSTQSQALNERAKSLQDSGQVTSSVRILQLQTIFSCCNHFFASKDAHCVNRLLLSQVVNGCKACSFIA